MIDAIISSAEFEQYAKIVGEVPSLQDKKRDLLIMRQFHGGGPLFPKKLFLQPEFAHRYIEHHNQIRAASVPIMQDERSHLIVEGYNVHEDPYRLERHANEVQEFERRGADVSRDINHQRYWLRNSMGDLFTEQEREYCLKDIEDFDLDDPERLDAFWKATSGRCINEYCDRLIGSFRMASDLIMQKQQHRVHGMELSSPQSEDLPSMDIDFSSQDRLKFECRRIANLVNGFQKAVDNASCGSLIIGASHTKHGTPAPALKNVPYLEDVLPQVLPDTRLLIAEPHEKVWDAVEWAIE